MGRKEAIKNINKEVSPIGELLVSDPENNILNESIDKNKLNFTIDSLKEVDNYLDKVRKKKKYLNEQDIKKIILRCGTYLGEVIRRLKNRRFIWIPYNTASKISKGRLPLGEDLTTCFILYDKKNNLFWFPLAKSYKFIESGRADNLWSFAVVCLDFKEIKKRR